jgi:hypothetical protein
MATNGRYFPPRSLTRPLLSVIRDVDPDFDRDATKLRMYEFSNGRTFFEKPTTLFPYNED